jgi:hypothetical protein
MVAYSLFNYPLPSLPPGGKESKKKEKRISLKSLSPGRGI